METVDAQQFKRFEHLHVRARDQMISWDDMRLSGFKMASRLAVDIAIESLLENEVEEISRDGQEKYVPWVFLT